MADDIVVQFVGDPGIDPAEIDALTAALRTEILQVEEVDHVDPVSAGAAPEGAKGIDIAAIGSLVVGLTPGLQAVGKVVEVVRQWLSARGSSAPPLQMTIGDRSITVTADKEQQDALVAAFIAALPAQDGGSAGTAPG